jgi:hypothetical protein
MKNKTLSPKLSPNQLFTILEKRKAIVDKEVSSLRHKALEGKKAKERLFNLIEKEAYAREALLLKGFGLKRFEKMMRNL